MYLTGYEDEEINDTGRMSYYNVKNIQVLESECERLQKELSDERLRAGDLIRDFNGQLDECVRIQKWRIVLAILLIIATVIAFIYVGKYNDMQEKYNSVQSAYDFYEQCAVIVGDDEKTYHSYGCSELETDDGFYIFNPKYAEWAGYEPCDVCQD